LSFRRKPESSYFGAFWTPAFAGVTVKKAFCEIIKIHTKSRIAFFSDYAR